MQTERWVGKQTEKQASRLRRAVSSLPAGDVKKLRGIDNGYRLRVGDVRVLFEKDSDNIIVFKIDSRGDVYDK